jgi:glycosyltransferase involved in cell wall biosynthesis
MKVPLLFPTLNRLEFTRIALENLIENTPPDLVSEILIIDAKSEDGTAEYLKSMLGRLEPFKPRIVENPTRHIVSTMKLAASMVTSEWIAKIDSDVMVPQGWLETSIAAVKRYPEIWVLGIGPMHDLAPVPKEGMRYARSRYVGGVGLFRKAAWEGIKALRAPYSGWMEHQIASSWVKGWAYPHVKVFLLNRLPFEPFLGLSLKYQSNGWQRPWGLYAEKYQDLWTWKYPHWKSMT